MGYETYRIADLIDEIAMGPFGSNIKVSCFVDSGVPVLNGSNLEGRKDIPLCHKGKSRLS